MLRGKIKFKCTECCHKFVAADFEYAATVYSMPQRCPECGSIRTMPNDIHNLFNKGAYKKIWEEMER